MAFDTARGAHNSLLINAQSGRSFSGAWRWAVIFFPFSLRVCRLYRRGRRSDCCGSAPLCVLGTTPYSWSRFIGTNIPVTFISSTCYFYRRNNPLIISITNFEKKSLPIYYWSKIALSKHLQFRFSRGHTTLGYVNRTLKIFSSKIRLSVYRVQSGLKQFGEDNVLDHLKGYNVR